MASQPASSSSIASARASPPPLSPPADPPQPPGGVNPLAPRPPVLFASQPASSSPLPDPPQPPGGVNPLLPLLWDFASQPGMWDPSASQPASLIASAQASTPPPQVHFQIMHSQQLGGGAATEQPPVIEEKKKVPWSDAPSPVRAVLNRPWPDPVVIPPTSPSGKYRILVATAKDIGPPITPEEMAALEDKEGDDLRTSHYKQFARINALKRNYIHEHGCLYMNEKYKFIFDNSILVEEIRCKYITAEEMEISPLKQGGRSTYLSELALANYNKRRKVKFELCEQLLCRSFWEDRGFFWHLNFTAKRNGLKTLFFAEIEDCGERSGESIQVCCCIPLDSLCEGGYYNWRSFSPSKTRKGLDMDRCYACTEFLKHPCDGLIYSGGHDYQRKTYLF